MSYIRATNSSAPSQIRCTDCNNVKSRDAFNGNSLRMLMGQMRLSKIDPQRDARIRCTSCGAKQVSEVQCCECGQWKGLNGFTKAQRRMRDEAKCIACIRIQVNTAPAGRDDEDGDSDDDSSSSGGAHSSDGETTSNLANPRGTHGQTSSATMWHGRSNDSRSNAQQYTASRSINTSIRPAVAQSVAGSEAGGVRVSSAAQRVAAAKSKPTVEVGQYVSDSGDDDYDDSDEEGSWMDRTSTILSCRMQMNIE